MTSCAVFIPVLGRPHRVEPLVASLAASQPPIAVHPVFVCSPGDADEIAAVRAAALEPLIADWEPDRGDYAKKMNHAWGNTTDEFVFLGADDLFFHPGWLTAALAVQVGACACVVGTNDLGNSRVTAGRHSTHSLVHREYGQWGTIDDPSKLLHEQYDHQFSDDEFIQTAMARDVFAFAPTSYVEHLHPHWRKAETDATYEKGQRAFDADRLLYEARRPLWAGSQRV